MAGKTIDVLVMAKRDKKAAMHFFFEEVIDDKDITVEVRQIQYRNNIVEQDYRAVRRNTRSMLGFKSFRVATNVLAGIELMHMIRKGQIAMPGYEGLAFADQFYALAGQIRPA